MSLGVVFAPNMMFVWPGGIGWLQPVPSLFGAFDTGQLCQTRLEPQSADAKVAIAVKE